MPEHRRRGGGALRTVLLRAVLALFTLGILGGAAVLGLVARYAAELPAVESLRDYNPSLITKIFGADGSVIG